MSSRVNLSLLVDHINNLPDDDVDVDPNLKFRILYCGPASVNTTNALPTLKQHFPESFFSFDVSTAELKKIDGESLHGKVQVSFMRKVCTYASLLRCKNAEPPEEILTILLPFIYGDVFSDEALGDVVAAAKSLAAWAWQA